MLWGSRTIKSVLIWFQNRRQERRKKAKVIATPALTRTTPSRPLESKPRSKKAKPSTNITSVRAKKTAKGKLSSPLAPLLVPGTTPLVTPQRNHPLESETPPSPLARAYSQQRTPCLPHLTPVYRQSRSASSNTLHSERRSPDLWKNLPPTPPSRSPSFMRSPRPSPVCESSLLQPLGNASNLMHSAYLTTGSRPDRPSLEWACANSAARRKHGLFIYRDEDDSSGESSEPEADLARGTGTRSGARLGAAAPKRSRVDRRRVLHEVAIPREYHALFSPDVVMGASLLLTLKHSADSE